MSESCSAGSDSLGEFGAINMRNKLSKIKRFITDSYLVTPNYHSLLHVSYVTVVKAGAGALSDDSLDLRFSWGQLHTAYGIHVDLVGVLTVESVFASFKM
jgi:hypothetical protein